MSERQPITIRFRFNTETGQIETFLVDDGDRTAPETYHDQIARMVAGELFRNPQIEDAGLGAIIEIPSTVEREGVRPRREGEA